MSIPDTTILPLHADRILQGGQGLERYFRDLVGKLQENYATVAEGVNGKFRRDTDFANQQWEPIIIDSANPGTTFVYTHQVGWALRKGIMVDLWFDVLWTNNSGAITGNMTIVLPYKVAITEQKPFVGLVQTSVFAYTAGTGCVINAQSNSFNLEVWNVGSGFTTANQSSVASGHLLGNIRYVGQGLERD